MKRFISSKNTLRDVASCVEPNHRVGLSKIKWNQTRGGGGGENENDSGMRMIGVRNENDREGNDSEMIPMESLFRRSESFLLPIISACIFSSPIILISFPIILIPASVSFSPPWSL